jgi:hypothetical protein
VARREPGGRSAGGGLVLRRQQAAVVVGLGVADPAPDTHCHWLPNLPRPRFGGLQGPFSRQFTYFINTTQSAHVQKKKREGTTHWTGCPL